MESRKKRELAGLGGNQPSNTLPIRPPPENFSPYVDFQMCENMKKMGDCYYGDGCTFAHNRAELAFWEEERAGVPRDPPQGFFLKLCPNAGHCPYGRRCLNAHSREELSLWSRWEPASFIRGEERGVSDEEAQQILEDALQDGSVPQSCLKVLAAGAARSGKTLSRKHIFGMKFFPHAEASPNIEHSPSTGVYDPPLCTIRDISLQMLDTSHEEWEPLTEEKLLIILARKLQEGSIRGKVAEVVRNRIEASNSTPVVEASSIANSDSDGKKIMVRTLSGQPQKTLPAKKEEFKLQLILFLDSGGQPQFHEVLPALSHHISLIMLFLKLNERLDDFCCTTFTDENGKDYSTHSSLTYKQMLLQLVHTMRSKELAEGKFPKLMVVGTHLDQIEKCTETLDMKNYKLERLFGNLGELIRYKGKIIFPVNALNPDKKSKKVFGEIRRVIARMRFDMEEDTPLSWFLFQNDLINHRKQHGTDMVNKEECLAIARKLKINEKSLEGALNHFNKKSIFLYYPSVFLNLVFIDPQFPLKVVNECVAFSYKVQGDSPPTMETKHLHLWKEGTISHEMLQRVEFSSCFVDNVFDVGQALHLLQNLHIIAPISESEFLMPCILPLATDKEIENSLPQCDDESVAPLLVHFPNGRIPNGTFCATHNCMRSVHKWTTCHMKPIESKEEVEPNARQRKVTCLYRNVVKLQHPDEAVTITFVHASSLKHFEVHVETDEKDLIPEVCQEIYDHIFDSISNVERTFHYKKSGATLGFLCPCDEKNRHVATLNRRKTSFKCTHTSEFLRDKPVKEGHKVWIKGPAPRTTTQGATGSTETIMLDSRPHLNQLHSLGRGEKVVKIREGVAAEWPKLAAQLKFEQGAIAIINTDNKGSCEAAFDKLMNQWLDGAGSLPVSWKTLLLALDEAGFKTVASDVRKVLGL